VIQEYCRILWSPSLSHNWAEEVLCKAHAALERQVEERTANPAEANARLKQEIATCRKIVERHGGNITAKSTPGQGATLTVTLPLRQTQGAEIP
jgi:light-regulated signal transduction histidine kinase (bacteriophytochrome)